MAKIREGKYAPLKTKLQWSALFLLCFLIGRNIPVPYLHKVARGTSQANGYVIGDGSELPTALGHFLSVGGTS